MAGFICQFLLRYSYLPSRSGLNRLVLFVLAVGVMGTGSCLAQPNWIGAGAKVSRGTITCYAPKELKPMLTLRLEQGYGDYQTRGFFRIGVLPLLVVEGLEVELHDAGRSFAALTNLPSLLGQSPNPKEALELRRFALVLPEPKRPVLTAQSVRILNGTTWQLRNGKLILHDGTEQLFRRAVLTVAGPHCGEFVCETTRTNLGELLQFSSPTEPPTKSPP